MTTTVRYVLLTLALSGCASQPELPNPGPLSASTVENGDNYNRLHAYVRFKRPGSIVTVSAAIRYYLDTTGYRANLPRSMELQSVPPERSREPVTIETAIVRVVGHTNRWNVDHVAKTLTIEPMPIDAPLQRHITNLTDDALDEPPPAVGRRP